MRYAPKHLVCLLFTLAAATQHRVVCWATQQPLAKGYIIPFQHDPLLQPHIIVQIRVNGKGPFPVVYDTGANIPLTLDQSLVKELGLDPKDEGGTISPGDRAMRTARTETVQIDRDGGAITIRGLSVGVADLSALQEIPLNGRVVGIIGAPLLDNFAVSLDFQRKAMTFYPGEWTAPKAGKAISIPLKKRDGMYYVTASMTGGLKAEMLLDTGSDSTSIPSAVAKRLPPMRTSSQSYMDLDGAVHTNPTYLIPEIKIGKVSFRNVTVSSEPTGDFVTLGLDILSQCRLTFDFPHAKLLLEPPDVVGTHVEQDGWIGAALAADGGAFRVDEVYPDSPAEEVGIKVGDRIISADGRLLAGLSLRQARMAMAAFAGTTAEIEVERDGTKRVFRVLRKSEFDANAGPFDGLETIRPPGSPIKVLGVLPSSAGAKAGLRTGDEIMRVNGDEVAKMSPEQLRDGFAADDLRIKYRRKGEEHLRETVLKTEQKR
jgi:predicted aspartyl protease